MTIRGGTGTADGNVGIGTTSPGEALTVHGNISGSATSTGSFGSGHFSGSVGIGTVSPDKLLHLKQDGMAADTNTDVLKWEGNYLLGILGAHDSVFNSGKLELYKDGTAVNVSLNAADGEDNWFLEGNVGIGTSSPSELLHISKSQNTDTTLQITNTYEGNAAMAQLKLTSAIGDAFIKLTDDAYATANWQKSLIIQADTPLDGGIVLYSSDKIRFQNAFGKDAITMVGGNVNIYSGSLILEGNESGNISGSATSTGSFGSVHSADKVGIGTTSPGEALEVIGNAKIDGTEIYNGDASLFVGAAGDLVLGMDWNANFTGNAIKFTVNEKSNSPSNTLMIISESGYVGIGTTSPSELLEIEGATNPAIQIQDTTNNVQSQLNAYDSWGNVGTLSNHPFNIMINGSRKVTIDTGGNVGIGNLNPTEKLSVAGTISATGSITPGTDDTYDLGTSTKRWQDVYSVSTTTGGIFEVGLRTEGLKDLPTGTIVVWNNGKCVPCYKEKDELVMGVTREVKDEPIVLGAELILVTGKVDEGDYILTSTTEGHGKSVKSGYLFKKNLFGKVIGQALESAEGESSLIKCMVRKM